MNKSIQSNISGSRINYFDTLRLIAIVIIYTTHFINKFHPAYFSLWHTMPSSLFLNGLSGKFGVVLFGVILGYFAYSSKDNNSTRYVVKRYAFFVICGFIINLLFTVVGLLHSGFPEHSIKAVIVNSLLLRDGIFSTYWCIPHFFIASIISYINGKSKASAIVVLFEVMILYLCGQTWIGVCLIGNLVAMYLSNSKIEILKFRVVRIVLWIALFFAIKLPNYWIDAICCGAMLVLIEQGSMTKKVLNNKYTAYLGKQGMGIFLVHTLCYNLLGPVLFDWLSALPYSVAFIISIVVCFAVIILLSIPVMWFINFAIKKIGVFIVSIQEFVHKISKKYIVQA